MGTRGFTARSKISGAAGAILFSLACTLAIGGCQAYDRGLYASLIDVARIDTSPIDATDGDSGLTDAVADQFDTSVSPPPRLIAPISGSNVTTRTPTLRWTTTAPALNTRVRVCRSRDCATAEWDFMTSGTSARGPSALTPGLKFWRVDTQTTAGGPFVPSATWEFIALAHESTHELAFGTSVDVNGDGRVDVLVGAPAAMTNTGRAFVFHGVSMGVPSSPATQWTGPDGAGGAFGTVVCGAGDLNGDGYGDVAISAPGAFGMTGRVYVFYGSPSGIDTSRSTTIDGLDGGNAQFGYSLAAAGDINEDGYGDLVVGSPGALPGSMGSMGRAYVFEGGADGVNTTPQRRLDGSASGSFFGRSVTGAGDIDGDGIADIVVLATGDNSAHAWHGSSTGVGEFPSTGFMSLTGVDPGPQGDPIMSLTDLDGDGHADLVVGAADAASNEGQVDIFLSNGSPTSAPTIVLASPDGAGARFGSSIASGGDVDGDGIVDLVVGERGYSSGEGAAFEFRGASGGPVMSSMIRLAAPDGAGSDFGHSVGLSGDVDGDGFADVIVGAPGVMGAGRVVLFRGTSAGTSTMSTGEISTPDGGGTQFASCVGGG